MRKINTSEDTILYALRYALTRISQAPSVVATDIMKNIQLFEYDFLKRMVSEIKKKPLPVETAELWTSLCKDIEFEMEYRDMP